MVKKDSSHVGSVYISSKAAPACLCGCQDYFCFKCFEDMHRRGNRLQHKSMLVSVSVGQLKLLSGFSTAEKLLTLPHCCSQRCEAWRLVPSEPFRSYKNPQRKEVNDFLRLISHHGETLGMEILNKRCVFCIFLEGCSRFPHGGW